MLERTCGTYPAERSTSAVFAVSVFPVRNFSSTTRRTSFLSSLEHTTQEKGAKEHDIRRNTKDSTKLLRSRDHLRGTFPELTTNFLQKGTKHRNTGISIRSDSLRIDRMGRKPKKKNEEKTKQDALGL